MKLKLDKNLGKTAAALFQSAGYDTQTVPGQGLSKAADREVIAACQSEQRCLVTLDLDFGNPLLFDRWNCCSSSATQALLPGPLGRLQHLD
jgi:predicted nuclease of predicted toxin-antitoxin system